MSAVWVILLWLLLIALLAGVTLSTATVLSPSLVPTTATVARLSASGTSAVEGRHLVHVLVGGVRLRGVGRVVRARGAGVVCAPRVGVAGGDCCHPALALEGVENIIGLLHHHFGVFLEAEACQL